MRTTPELFPPAARVPQSHGQQKILLGPEQEMPVVGHQAPGEDPHGDALCRFRQHPQEGQIVTVRFCQAGLP